MRKLLIFIFLMLASFTAHAVPIGTDAEGKFKTIILWTGRADDATSRTIDTDWYDSLATGLVDLLPLNNEWTGRNLHTGVPNASNAVIEIDTEAATVPAGYPLFKITANTAQRLLLLPSGRLSITHDFVTSTTAQLQSLTASRAVVTDADKKLASAPKTIIFDNGDLHTSGSLLAEAYWFSTEDDGYYFGYDSLSNRIQAVFYGEKEMGFDDDSITFPIWGDAVSPSSIGVNNSTNGLTFYSTSLFSQFNGLVYATPSIFEWGNDSIPYTAGSSMLLLRTSYNGDDPKKLYFTYTPTSGTLIKKIYIQTDTGLLATSSTLRINGGSPADGKVWTATDSNGNGQWETPAAGTVTSVSGTAPIASSGGATPAISIANAAADGSTKGAASFVANDFDASSGNIGIDYTNGQAASASLKGFLAAADFTKFNNVRTQVLATIHIGNGSDVPATGLITGEKEFAQNCTITRVVIAGKTAGDAVVDLWVDSTYPPTDADSITSGTPPELDGEDRAVDTTLTGWDVTCAQGSTLFANLDSISGITDLTVTIIGTID